eukprot:353082-Chlamydomonas_euryale.AAC.15
MQASEDVIDGDTSRVLAVLRRSRLRPVISRATGAQVGGMSMLTGRQATCRRRCVTQHRSL